MSLLVTVSWRLPSQWTDSTHCLDCSVSHGLLASKDHASDHLSPRHKFDLTSSPRHSFTFFSATAVVPSWIRRHCALAILALALFAHSQEQSPLSGEHKCTHPPYKDHIISKSPLVMYLKPHPGKATSHTLLSSTRPTRPARQPYTPSAPRSPRPQKGPQSFTVLNGERWTFKASMSPSRMLNRYCWLNTSFRAET